MGFSLVELLVTWHQLRNPMKELIILLLTILISLAIGLLPFIDNFAHIGGFVTGALSGMVIVYMKTTSSLLVRGIGIISIFVLFIAGLIAFFQIPDIANWCPICLQLDCIPLMNWCNEGFKVY
jgi:hypothetical protein